MPRHIGENADFGDYAAQCNYCNGYFLRSELYRDRQGLLRCESEEGREPLELDEANVAASQEQPPTATNDGGKYPSESTDGLVTLEAQLALLGTP